MGTRLELDAKFRQILGNNNTYFRPPRDMHLNYPCVIYKLYDFDITKADNIDYIRNKQYELTYVTRDADDIIPEVLLDEFKYIRFTRHYFSDGLDYYVYRLTY